MMNSSVYDGDRAQNWSSSDENGEKAIQVGHANKISYLLKLIRKLIVALDLT